MLGSELTNGLAILNYNIYANDINFTYKIAKVKNIKLSEKELGKLKIKLLKKFKNICLTLLDQKIYFQLIKL